MGRQSSCFWPIAANSHPTPADAAHLATLGFFMQAALPPLTSQRVGGFASFRN
jgi:hypothetical protein